MAGRRSRRGRGGSGAGNARWLTTYGDAMTLLLAFFVMLYVMSEIDAKKFEMFVRGLEVPFGNPAMEQPPMPQSDGIVGDMQMPPELQPEAIRLTDALPRIPEPATDDEERKDPETPEEADDEEEEPDSPDVPEPPEEPSEEDLDLADEPDRDLDQLREIREALNVSLTEAGHEQAADYRIDERGLVVSISADDVLFDLGSTVINDEGVEVVTAIAEVLEGYPNDMVVEGHTDDHPIRRPDYTNWNLSTDRAVAVLSMLYEDFDFAEHRLGAAGYGEWRPRVPNDSEANRAKNRRVDVLVVAREVS